MPGDNQKSITVSLELYESLEAIAKEDSRSIPGEIEFLVKREISIRRSENELEIFRRGTKKILGLESKKNGGIKLL